MLQKKYQVQKYTFDQRELKDNILFRGPMNRISKKTTLYIEFIQKIYHIFLTSSFRVYNQFISCNSPRLIATNLVMKILSMRKYKT